MDPSGSRICDGWLERPEALVKSPSLSFAMAPCSCCATFLVSLSERPRLVARRCAAASGLVQRWSMASTTTGIWCLPKSPSAMSSTLRRSTGYPLSTSRSGTAKRSAPLRNLTSTTSLRVTTSRYAAMTLATEWHEPDSRAKTNWPTVVGGSSLFTHALKRSRSPTVSGSAMWHVSAPSRSRKDPLSVSMRSVSRELDEWHSLQFELLTAERKKVPVHSSQYRRSPALS